MLETILCWLAIWFNVGVLAQVIMCLVDALVNRRWPFHWRDSKHFVLAGCFGFISMLNVIVFFIKLAIVGGDAFSSEDDEEEKEGVFIEVALTNEEINKVQDFVEQLIAARETKEKKDVE